MPFEVYEVASRHRFRRIARIRQRRLERENPLQDFRTERMTEGQARLWGRRWAVVRTK